MNPYKSKDEFVAILSELWNRIFRTREIIDAVSAAKLIVRFRFTDFKTDFYVDITGDIPRFFWDPEAPPGFDVEMILSSEVNHAFWMEDLNVPLALASRKIIAKGSVQKALKLLPALKPAFALYPLVLADRGRGDLLRKPEKRKGIITLMPCPAFLSIFRRAFPRKEKFHHRKRFEKPVNVIFL